MKIGKTKQPQAQAVPLGMEAVAVPSLISWYAAGACWVAYAVALPLYRPTDYLIVAAISAVVFIALRLLLPKTIALVPLQLAFEKTGDRDADILLQFGGIYLRKLIDYNAQQKDAQLRAALSEVPGPARALLDDLAQTPARALHLRDAVNFYLPSALSLVDGYLSLVSRGVRGPVADRARDAVGTLLRQTAAVLMRVQETLSDPTPLDLTQDINDMRRAMKDTGLLSDAMIADLGRRLDEEGRPVTEEFDTLLEQQSANKKAKR